MSNRIAVLLVLVVGLVFVGSNSIYILNEMERGVLLRLGKVVNPDIATGLHLKLPFMEEVRIFDGRVLTVDAPAERFLTLEKKALIVDSFAKFKIKKVEKYYTATSGDQRRAEELLKQRINNGLRNEISKRTLHEVVSGERDELMEVLVASLNEVADAELGVEVVDVRVKRIDLPQEVSQSVYNRMNTERDIEAKEHRAKGQELAVGIRADADKQREVILAEAYSEAESLRGEGDAEAAATYAQAFNQDKEFYKFYRSMAAYKRTFSDKNDMLILDPNSDFFSYLKDSQSGK
ncbi:MAG: protease modulator HflC [Pseudomonadales bacterium]|jgi:membrane protease subunit HflC|nr:protease modulator HflC [Pseudomonadales bacterium]MDA0956202.1 protease modulator HflC [Pseudomonadota bacterium]